ncbi:histidine phosphatase family protein [Sphingosinicella sp.]|uniref:SixA phosphatase family protein n=1 Tax=Sphingosinicella sp. TaxID=1917971 RepID=UPI00262BDA8E|nr:histidine phosphatase family protein [Sphingosinicella sp.]
MKTIFLLRHAKSSWDDPVERDFDRPLNTRGRRAAETIGRYLREQNLAFDSVVASPAVRVIETLDGVESGAGRRLGATFDKRVYMASAPTLLDIVHETDAEAETLLLVGHNPGLEDLIFLLTPAGSGELRREVDIKYPTATLAEMRFDVDRWEDIDEAGGELVRFIRPRDLDPALGPDGT